MIDRIIKNEERFDNILDCIEKLSKSVDEYKNNQNNLRLLNKYYESNNWLKDKDAYDNNQIKKIKAGVLSEDGVWNMLEDLDDLMIDLKNIVDNYFMKKNVK